MSVFSKQEENIMTGRKPRRSAKRTLGILTVFAVLIVIGVFEEIARNLITLVFLGLIPVAYVARTRIERRKHAGNRPQVQPGTPNTEDTIPIRTVPTPESVWPETATLRLDYPPKLPGCHPVACWYPTGPHSPECNPGDSGARPFTEQGWLV
jgi:hypothetical protein